MVKRWRQLENWLEVELPILMKREHLLDRERILLWVPPWLSAPEKIGSVDPERKDLSFHSQGP